MFPRRIRFWKEIRSPKPDAMVDSMEKIAKVLSRVFHLHMHTIEDEHIISEPHNAF